MDTLLQALGMALEPLLCRADLNLTFFEKKAHQTHQTPVCFRALRKNDYFFHVFPSG
jgi:hypothetical protein